MTLRSRVSVPRNASAPGIDVIVAFFERRAEFERRLPGLMEAVGGGGSLWIAWPKASSGVPTVCAIDETWSGLRLVYRRQDRAALREARGEAAPGA